MKVSKEIKIALLGIVAIVMFIFGYNYLKGSDLFSSTKTVKALYDQVQGLTPANYVQLQGLNIGTVKTISMSKQYPGKVEVEMTVDKDVFIPEDSKARIVSLDLLGTKAITVIKGSSTTNIKDKQLLNGDMELGAIESLSAAALPAVDGAKQTIHSLDQTIQSVNQIIDVNTQQHLKSTIANLDKTMADFTQFANELNAQRTKISSLLNNLNAFTDNLNKNNTTINSMLKNAEQTTAKLSKLDLENTVAELKTTLNGLQTTLDKVNNGQGSLALLMNDDKLYKNLKNTLSTANNLLYDINARPSRYINVNIFGKKQKDTCPPQPAPNSND
ncbi:MAG: MCE family protein [Chitinophagaceae bacterium]|nr:MCE family protein [Chitinophagaceae bacterium]